MLNVLNGHVDKIQLLFIFLNSFFLSRLLIATRIPERLVFYLIGKKHLPVSQITLALIGASALLSFFIPNVMTVFTLLPVMKLLSQSFERALPEKYREIETLLPLTIIYGANIGGIGSITGTPANGILVVYATIYTIPGREYLTFEYWLLWGIPLAALFVLLAWGVLSVSFRLWNYQNERIQVAFEPQAAVHPLQRIAIVLASGFFLTFILFSILMKTSSHKELVLVITVLSSLLLLGLLFFMPFRVDRASPPQRLLTLADCGSDLPWRGLGVVAIIIVLLAIGMMFHLQDGIIALFRHLVRENLPIWAFFLVVAALTSFSTEVFSNTVVQLAMFTVVLPLFKTTALTTFQALLIITLSSTCAFMTPIATGVNGLAFGEMKGIALPKMLTAGLFMKLVAVVVIGFGVPALMAWLV